MNEHWYCYINDKTVGPFTDDELSSMATTGTITPKHLVCRGLEGNWVTASTVVGLFQNTLSPTAKGTSGESSIGDGPSTLRVAKPLAPKPKRSQSAPPVRASGDSALGSAPAPAPLRAAPARAVAPAPLAPAPVAPAPVVPPAQKGAAVVRAASQPATGAAGSTHIQHLRNRRKHRTSSIVATVVTATVAALLLGVIAIISMSVNKKAKNNDDQETGRTTAAKAGRRQKSKRSRRQTRDATSDVERAVEAIAKLTPTEIVNGIKDWRNRSYSPTVGNLQITVTDVWHVNNKLHVNVQVANKAARGPDAYFTSWEGLSQKSKSASPLLVNGSGDILKIDAPNALTISLYLNPGQSVTETLTFPSPVDMEQLKLVIPYTAFGRSGQYGFLIPGDQIADKAPAEPADALGKPPNSDDGDKAVAPQAIRKQRVAVPNVTERAGKAADRGKAQDKAAGTIESTVGKMPGRGIFGGNGNNGADPRTPSKFEDLKKAIERARVDK